MAENKSFTYSIVTPQVSHLDRSAESLVVPAWDGELGIRYNHAPLVARLSAGEMRVTFGAVTEAYFINGGFLQVNQNKVSVITTEAIPCAELDAAASREALAAAEALPAATAEETAARQEAIRAAKARLRLAEGRKAAH